MFSFLGQWMIVGDRASMSQPWLDLAMFEHIGFKSAMAMFNVLQEN